MKKIFILFLTINNNQFLNSAQENANIIATRSPLQPPTKQSPKTVHQETYPPSPNSSFSKLPAPAIISPLQRPTMVSFAQPQQPIRRNSVHEGTQCNFEDPLGSAQGILDFLNKMFNPSSPYPLMKIQSSRIKTMIKLQLLYYLGRNVQNQNYFEYTNPKSFALIQKNESKTSIFTEENEQGIAFTPNFDEQIRQILEKSSLKLPAEIIPSFLNIITCRKEGLLIREENGQIRFIP